MADPGSSDVGQVDRLVHEPARMGILTVLQRIESADFLFLQNVLGVTKGNLSSHLAKLEAGGLVTITKSFVGKKPHTSVGLTPQGRAAITRHWEQLERLRNLGS
ncbi:transcriptional regulator, ArsR family [Streptomyces sp. WMMB 714]|jgi:DNA-binding MarR family transcriptional regulator|uniref:winged helix-turn-helix domain-containing protein n=1 Tax=Streptomyces sp. WMMB 714 TaxID=1286822 RepID=UPI0005F82A79|nr:transcriptional regulator [Streptomyces sp. WMMB 714]SCK47945.1 transcriptional regulator, ArsR family [Streptomyces sp. WMMB 714]